MNSENIYDALTDVREDFIIEAKTHKLSKPRYAIVRWCAIAASFALIIGIGGFLMLNGRIPAPGASQGGGGRADGSTTFMSYAGPVFPLSVLDDSTGITASRDITFDFSGFGERPLSTGVLLNHREIMVSDNYVLTNDTTEDKTVRVVYPFAGSFYELHRQLPTITSGGFSLDTELMAGPYSGGFSDVEGLEGMLVNFRLINSYTPKGC